MSNECLHVSYRCIVRKETLRREKKYKEKKIPQLVSEL